MTIVGAGRHCDMAAYDAILIHYSVRLSINNHISSVVAKALRSYNGPKVLFIQDEYDTTETARLWIERLGIDAIFTNVPLGDVASVYPREKVGVVDFLPTLTGYVPEQSDVDIFVKPISQRTIEIGYRGRKLPYQYGSLGREKFSIGLEMKRRALARGLHVDIEVDDEHRIYGDDWYRFLGSSRATLGTESGSNVFDEDGSLARLANKHSGMSFDEFHERFLKGREGVIKMNQVSPKIFEAIRLRTALILFEGSYSGVVQPDLHFIPLKKDYSNVDEVFYKLADLNYLKAMADRAFSDVIGSGRYSYQAFVGGVDAYLDWRIAAKPRARIFASPRLVFYNDGTVMPRSERSEIFGYVTDMMMGRDLLAVRSVPNLVDESKSEDVEHPFITKASQSVRKRVDAWRDSERMLGISAKYIWRQIPLRVRTRLARILGI